MTSATGLARMIGHTLALVFAVNAIARIPLTATSFGSSGGNASLLYIEVVPSVAKLLIAFLLWTRSDAFVSGRAEPAQRDSEPLLAATGLAYAILGIGNAIQAIIAASRATALGQASDPSNSLATTIITIGLGLAAFCYGTPANRRTNGESQTFHP